MLENKWKIKARKIFTYNNETSPLLEVINLSMACNHCESAACMDGCPANAYHRDHLSGAVLIEAEKCLGCNYCKWNCPFDAPETDLLSKEIRKCNLCRDLVIEGGVPACTSACPTGALSYGDVPETTDNKIIKWFPGNDLNPALNIIRGFRNAPTEIVPDNLFNSDNIVTNSKARGISQEWSLVAFTFLSMISVALIISFLITGNGPEPLLFSSIILAAGIFSSFHLSKKTRSWRALRNIFQSPLSREVLLYVLFLTLSILSAISSNIWLLLAASIAGLIFLLSIDAVYTFSDKRKVTFFHSGQTFISGLLTVSFFAGLTIPFMFVGLLKSASMTYHFIQNRGVVLHFGFRFFRLSALFFTAFTLLTSHNLYDPFIWLLFLAGELTDRVLFYLDFEPGNIKNSITNDIISAYNETKRG